MGEINLSPRLACAGSNSQKWELLHEPLAQTAKVDPQIAEISVNRHHSSLSARRRFGTERGSPFDTGFTSLQTLFTGTLAKVASLIAIVIGGYGFAHGEPGAKKALAGVAAGTGIAVLAANVLSWLWGV